MQHSKILRGGLLGLAPLVLAAGAQAQTPLSGSVSDSAGGPLLAGQVYFSTGSLTVPAGETLTIQPGAILKLGAGHLVTVSGTLSSPAGATAWITSIGDDSIGGDTGGDGPSAGAQADWAGIRVLADGALDLRDAVIRYAGSSFYSAVYGSGGTIALANCDITDNDGPGIDANGYDVDLVVTGTHIANCTGAAMADVRIEQVPNFSANSAAGNAGGDVIRLWNVNLARDTAIVADDLLGGALVLTSSSAIPAGTTLSLGAGLALKVSSGALIDVYGRFEVNGTASSPTYLTSVHDDAAFGDSAGDGATVGALADWAGIRFLAGGVLRLDHTVVRYAGASFYTALYASGGDLEVYDSTIASNDGAGLDANGYDTTMVVERTAFLDNSGPAMEEVRIERVPEFSANTASGNGGGDVLRLHSSGPVRDTLITADDLHGDGLIDPFSRTIGTGLTLEFGPGTFVKHGSGTLWTVDGVLRLAGVDGAPVVHTSLADDATAGDSPNDGPSAGLAADWAGLRVLTGGHIEADHTVVRFAGSSFYCAFYVVGGSLDLYRCAAEFGDGPGIDYNGYAVPTQVVACRFDANQGVAIDEAPIEIVAGFDANTGTGNLGGDFVRATTAAIVGLATVEPRDLIDGCLVVPGSLTINAGGELRLAGGTAVKFNPGSLLSVAGKLTARGTATDRILLSSFGDDTLGGDSNLDGPSVGSPSDWAGIRTLPSAGGNGVVDLEQVLVRNGGASFYTNLWIAGPGHTLRAVRSEASSDEGFRFDAGASAQVVNCVAYGNGTAGFECSSAMTLDFVTAYGNGTGVAAAGAGSATVRSSIVWGNGLDLGGTISAADTTALNAPAGNGNSTADPLFVDAPNGDLRLALGSPAVDAGDSVLAVAVAMDALDAPRLGATAGSLVLAADQGAYEWTRWTLSRSGEPAIGESLTFQVDGEAGIALIAYSTNQFPLVLEPYGVLLIGPFPLYELGTFGVGTPVSVPLPVAPVIVGIDFAFQALGVRTPVPGELQLTDVERFTIGAELP